MSAATISHSDLCQIATQWLYGSGRCKFVVKEATMAFGEQPDAIGWRGGYDTTLVECKAYRSDFLADKRKSFRSDNPEAREIERGMGRFRYYLCPAGLISRDELPPRWGLVYVYPSGTVRRVVEAQAWEREERNVLAEVFIMFKLLDRFAGTGRWHQVLATWDAEPPNEPLPLPAPIYDSPAP